MRRPIPALLATGSLLALAMTVSACGGGDDDSSSPQDTMDTTSVPGYTLSPAATDVTVTVAPPVTGPAPSKLVTSATELAKAIDVYIAAGYTQFATSEDLLDPTKFLNDVGWPAPHDVELARIDTDDTDGVSYAFCLAKPSSGAWVVYDSKKKKVTGTGPSGTSCADM